MWVAPLLILCALAVGSSAAALEVPIGSRGRAHRGRGQPYASQSSSSSASRPIDPPLLTALIGRAEDVPTLLRLHDLHGDTFNHVHHSRFWHQAGLISRRSTQSITSWQAADVWQPVVAATVDSLQTSTFWGRRELAGAAHGLAKAGLHVQAAHGVTEPLWTALAAASLARLPSYTPRELSTTAWSFARSRLPTHRTMELFEALGEAMVGRVSGASPQGVANTAWGFATAGHVQAQLFDKLAQAVVARVYDYKPQELVNVAWAFAALARPAPKLFEAIATAARPRLFEFSSHERATLAWAYAAADCASAGDILFGGRSPFAQLCSASLNADGDVDPGARCVLAALLCAMRARLAAVRAACSPRCRVRCVLASLLCAPCLATVRPSPRAAAKSPRERRACCAYIVHGARAYTLRMLPSVSTVWTRAAALLAPRVLGGLTPTRLPAPPLPPLLPLRACWQGLSRNCINGRCGGWRCSHGASPEPTARRMRRMRRMRVCRAPTALARATPVAQVRAHLMRARRVPRQSWAIQHFPSSSPPREAAAQGVALR